MTEIYGLFDAADPMDPDRVYTSAAFARLIKTMMRDGVVNNDGDELAVGPTVPAAMSVSVGTGMVLVQGRYLINDADLTLPVDAADPSHPRIDRVVVRADLVGRTVHTVVKKGTAATSPVAPTLTRTAETWELSLAQVRVEAGATSILSAKITDERGSASLCGVAAPVYVPSSQVEVVGAINMQGKALTGLPAPSAGTDAATKAYADSAGIPKISLMQVDADKDWNDKSITNINELDASGNIQFDAFKVVKSDFVQYTDPNVSGDVGQFQGTYYHLTATTGVLVRYDLPAGIGDGSTVTLKLRYSTNHNSASLYIRVNGVIVSGPHTSATVDADLSVDLSIDQGDYIDIYGTAGPGQSITVWWPRICYQNAFDNWTATGPPVA